MRIEHISGLFDDLRRDFNNYANDGGVITLTTLVQTIDKYDPKYPSDLINSVKASVLSLYYYANPKKIDPTTFALTEIQININQTLKLLDQALDAMVSTNVILELELTAKDSSSLPSMKK